MTSKTILAAVATISSLATAGANSITIDATALAPTWTLNTNYWTGPGPSNLDSAGIMAIVGNDPLLTLAYKKDFGGSEGGPGNLKAAYNTTFSNADSDASDPENALIDWVGPGFVSGSEIYLYVKDGAQDPGFYLFNLTGLWDGQGDITLRNFWLGAGAISNVAIHAGGTTSVPDGGTTAALLGFGLVGIGLGARRFQLV